MYFVILDEANQWLVICSILFPPNMQAYYTLNKYILRKCLTLMARQIRLDFSWKECMNNP